MVGQFVGNAPKYSQNHGTTNLLWGRKCIVDVMALGNDACLFKFKNVVTRNWMLNSGPWYIGNRPIFLRKYEKGLTIKKLNMPKFPIWLNIWNITLDFLSVEGIGYIASGVGEPLCLDKATEDRKRIHYAKGVSHLLLILNTHGSHRSAHLVKSWVIMQSSVQK